MSDSTDRGERLQQAEWYDHVKNIEDIFLGIEARLGNQVVICRTELHRLEDNARLADGLVRSLLDDNVFRSECAAPMLARALKMEFKCAALCVTIDARRAAFFDESGASGSTATTPKAKGETSTAKNDPTANKTKKTLASSKKETVEDDPWAQEIERKDSRERGGSMRTLNLPDYRGPDCKTCNQRHPLFRCPTFLTDQLWLRWQFVKERHACANCLRYSCGPGVCPDDCCRKCTESHNRTLCPQRKENFP